MKAVVISKHLTPQVLNLAQFVPGWELVTADDDVDALRKAPDAEVAVCWGTQWPGALVREDANLRWIQAVSAGVEALVPPLRDLERQGRPIILTNARGAHGAPIAEHVLGMVLAFSRGLLACQRAQSRSEWVQFQPVELSGQTAGIVGFGSIGQAIAAKLQPLGVRLLATRARPEPNPLVEQVMPPEGLDTILAESDIVILAAPAIRETEALIAAPQLARMKRGALLVNIARGSLIDEPALVAALRDGTIGGAALDVFAKEPLPEDSPLWQVPNLLISPHISALSPRTMERTFGIVAENLRRFAAGQPVMNVVDKERGY